jgi:hypothetical protein
MVNMIAMKVLGDGHTGFGPGADGGRDGYFVGTAPYPSAADQWSGNWYVQCKFMAPSLSGSAQKWLVDRVDEELNEFMRPDSKRSWPDNWIIATNVDPSGKPESGSFDKIIELVLKANRKLGKRTHIWGGQKLLQLLGMHPEIQAYYAEFLTPGHVLSQLYEKLGDESADIKQIIRYLVVTQLTEQQYTRLEQAGSSADNRPGIQRLFTDLPFVSRASGTSAMAAEALACSASQNHRVVREFQSHSEWRAWNLEPRRARMWFVKGGPGQGKSTLTQYVSQIQRAAIVLGNNGLTVNSQQLAIADEVRLYAERSCLWPSAPRIPIVIELKEFAQWYGRLKKEVSRRIVTYLAEKLGTDLGQTVHVGTLNRAFGTSRWLFVFDGLDEVPGDAKDGVASEVTYFVDDVLVGSDADALIVCTSRPQGYSGQFNGLDAAVVELAPLSPQQALACATPVLSIDRSESEAAGYLAMLREAIESAPIQEIMTTPLQSHIMAIVVRDGGRPPERKWQLFSNFYQTIKRREANRNLPDGRVAALLREEDQLIKALHNRLGFELHSRAERSQNAVTSLDRMELERVVRSVVTDLKDLHVEETIEVLMEATTDRLVLVNTPEASTEVRFDIRPLQEFFAAEYIYDTHELSMLSDRLRTISADSHWREVIHFLLSGLIETGRKGELAAAVNVLTQLNSGTDDQNQRGLNRRLAIGSIIGARLLQEGVLEQDRRVRATFRDCIEPLLACTDALDYLSDDTPTQSAAWFSDVVLDAVLERAESESVGAAAYLLGHLLDEHRRRDEAKVFFLSCSPSFLNAVIEQFVGNALSRSASAALRSTWSVDVVGRSCSVQVVQQALAAVRPGRRREHAAAVGSKRETLGSCRA